MEAISTAGSVNISKQRCTLTEPGGYEAFKLQLYDRITTSSNCSTVSTSPTPALAPQSDVGKQPVASTVTRGNASWSGAGSSKVAATPLEHMKGAKSAVTTDAEKALYKELAKKHCSGDKINLAKLAMEWNERAHTMKEAKVSCKQQKLQTVHRVTCLRNSARHSALR
jgi:hypothetical protein